MAHYQNQYPVGSGNSFDATVDFNTTNPNTGGTVFTPNTPASTTVLYVSSVDGSQWTYNGTSYITAPISTDWKITGNVGTTQATHFIGTTDNVGLSFRTANQIRQTITNTGNVGIGTTTPVEELHVQKNQTSPTRILIDNVGPISATTSTSLGLGEGTLTYAEFRRFRDGSGRTEVGNIQNAPLNLFTSDLTRMTILGDGKVGIGTTSPTTLFNVQNTASTNVALFKSLNGGGGYAVRGESVNGGAATGIYGELGVFDGTHWSGVRGNSGVSNMPAIKGINTITDGLSAYFNQRVGIGTTAPTSTLHINGSEAGTITNITATTTLNATHHKVLVSNGATSITITFPDALTCLGREYVISRAAGSTGAINVVGSAGNQIQALTGTIRPTTSIGLHGGTGQGLNHSFTAISIGGVGVWVRL